MDPKDLNVEAQSELDFQIEELEEKVAPSGETVLPFPGPNGAVSTRFIGVRRFF